MAERFQMRADEVEHSGDEEHAIGQLRQAGARAIQVERRPYADEDGQECVVLSFEAANRDAAKAVLGRYYELGGC